MTFPCAARRRAEISAGLIDTLHREYGIDKPAKPVDLGGSYNLNLLLRGSLVARVYHGWMTARRLEALQRIRRYLNELGIPTAPMKTTLDGHGWCTFNGRLIEVEHFVSATETMDSQERLVAGISMLAKLHDTLRVTPFGPAAATTPIANHLPPASARDWAQRGLRIFDGCPLTGDESHYVAVVQQLADELHDAEAPFRRLPQQLVHGDFWDNNVHFRDGEIVLIGDFDFVGLRARIDDLALTLFYANSELDRPDALRELADAYDAALQMQLSSVERVALPYAIARSPLAFIAHLALMEPNEARVELAQRGPQCARALAAVHQRTWLRAFC